MQNTEEIELQNTEEIELQNIEEIDMQNIEKKKMQNIKEEWRDVPFEKFKNTYIVSNKGRVANKNQKYNKNMKKFLSVKEGNTGYLEVRLDTGKDSQRYDIHILVAKAFIGERPEGFVIDHIDGEQHNNCLINLEYVTYEENNRRAIKNNLINKNPRKPIKY